MKHKVSITSVTQVALLLIFIGAIALPMAFTNVQSAKISVAENRKLTDRPHLYVDGQINKAFLTQFEAWVNDNVGFRDELTLLNNTVQYRLFGILPSKDNHLGPNGELNYATASIIADYQRVNLPNETYLKSYIGGFQKLQDAVTRQGSELYYLPCWDKQTIYPEQFSSYIHVKPHTKLKNDVYIEVLQRYTTVPIINIKQMLIDKKASYNTYNTWADPTHWSQLGAYLSYLEVMKTFNAGSAAPYKVLQESDFTIQWTDQGRYLGSGIHQKDMQEAFTLTNPQAHYSDEAPLFVSPNASKSRKILINDAIDNQDTLLIVGDSYVDSIYPYFGESFHRVVQVWHTWLPDMDKLIAYYKPRIVLVENAQRVDIASQIIKYRQTHKAVS